VKSYEFLFWAYNVIWAGIAGFLLFVLLRLRRTERRLDRVERELERESGAAGRSA
jgi:CcmD family protein